MKKRHEPYNEAWIALEDRFMIVTFYGPPDKAKRLRSRIGARSEWLMIGDGSS